MDPGIITIKTAGYCKDCPFMDLRTHRIYSANGLYTQTVECFYHDMCDRVYHVTVESLKEMKSF